MLFAMLAFMLLSFACGAVFHHGCYLIQQAARAEHSARTTALRSVALDPNATHERATWTLNVADENEVWDMTMVATCDDKTRELPAFVLDSADKVL